MLALVSGLVGCASAATAGDGGSPADVSVRDGTVDASTRRDATNDVGNLLDVRRSEHPPTDAKEAATLDVTPDARLAEAAADAGPIVPRAACTGTAADVYAAVPNLPPMTDALRGDIIACTSDGTLSPADVQSQMTAKGDVGVSAFSGVAIYRVQYRTTRSTGADGTSSARIYLPLVPIAPTPSIVVATHGTEGLASSCATSMDSSSMTDLALPWATLGHPVIAPDYAGLGPPGVQGYQDNRDTARSVIDSVAALRKFVAGSLGEQVVVDGQSQGGGAALATQALAKSMGLQGALAGVIAFAPEYFSRMDSLSYVGALESAEATNPLTIETGVTTCTVAVLMEYAYFANFVPSGLPTAGFPASDATKLGTAIESMCTVDLGGAVQAAAVHVADWTDATLRADSACLCCPRRTGRWGHGRRCRRSTGCLHGRWTGALQLLASEHPPARPIGCARPHCPGAGGHRDAPQPRSRLRRRPARGRRSDPPGMHGRSCDAYQCRGTEHRVRHPLGASSPGRHLPPAVRQERSPPLHATLEPVRELGSTRASRTHEYRGRGSTVDGRGRVRARLEFEVARLASPPGYVVVRKAEDRGRPRTLRADTD